MKSKKAISCVGVIFQWIAVLLILFWAYSFFFAHLVTKQTSNFYKIVEGLIILLALVNAATAKKLWHRVLWVVIALLFIVSLTYWIGWDMNKFQF